MSLYFPKENSIPASPSVEDLNYAQAFESLADILERSGQREKLTLLLSTCRNAYLTVNALFVDLRSTLGHGKQPSLLSQAVYFLRKKQVEDCRKRLHEASLPLSEFKKKREIWKTRNDLNLLLEKTLEATKPTDRARVQRILHTVRTSDPDRAQYWDGKFYELSTEEPAVVTEALQTLDASFAILESVVAACKGASVLLEETNLFENAGTARLERVFNILSEYALKLGIATTNVEVGEANSLAWNTNKCQVRWTRNSIQDVSDLSLCEAILDLIDSRIEEQYDALTEAFRPNVGIPPLPPPFCLDLTEPNGGNKDSTKPEVKIERLGMERPAKIRVALPWVGIPSGYYNSNSMRLLDSKRVELEHIARGFLMAATEQKAQVLILPEYFLPRSIAQELCDLAVQNGIHLIGGLEGQFVGADSQIHNEVLIQMPNQAQHFSVSKLNPSVYERPLKSTGTLRLFKGSSLGTFGVIVCSDLLDWHAVYAFADSGIHLDVLFVCTCNPATELFEHLAVADAHRFYSHVVVVNNHMDSDGVTANGSGTLVASPGCVTAKRFEKLTSPQNISVPTIGGCQPQLACVELSIQGLATDRVKPTDGLGAFPPWRNGNLKSSAGK